MAGLPRNRSEAFEIALGAIMTQNVTWKNAEKAILNLKARGRLQPERLLRMKSADLGRMIRPSGYYNQKALKIKNFLRWFGNHEFSFELASGLGLEGLRRELMGIRGIGPETADSMLLYAFREKVFVIDAYTKRIFSRMGLIRVEDAYEAVQDYFHRNFSGGREEYAEYHALIVAHAKEQCRKRVDVGVHCCDCVVKKLCRRNI